MRSLPSLFKRTEKPICYRWQARRAARAPGAPNVQTFPETAHPWTSPHFEQLKDSPAQAMSQPRVERLVWVGAGRTSWRQAERTTRLRLARANVPTTRFSAARTFARRTNAFASAERRPRRSLSLSRSRSAIRSCAMTSVGNIDPPPPDETVGTSATRVGVGRHPQHGDEQHKSRRALSVSRHHLPQEGSLARR